MFEAAGDDALRALNQREHERANARLNLTPAQAAGLAAGTHVVVPVEATDDMLDVGGGATTRNLLRSFYRKMVQRATAQKEG